MRRSIGFVLIALSACAAQSVPPNPAVLQPAVVARLEPLPPPPVAELPPAGSVGPLVIIGSDHITIDGKIVGVASQIDEVGRLQKIDDLFSTLQASRAAWKTAHPGEVFPGIASLVVAPGTSGLAFSSVYQTTAFAGFPTVRVAVNGRYHETLAQIPAPPCGAPEDPCPTGPPQYFMDAQADADHWRFRVRREDGPIDANGDGPRASAESFRAAAASVVATANVGAIVLRVAPRVPFARLGLFLAEAADLSETAHLTRRLTVSIREMSDGKGTASPEPISGTSFGGPRRETKGTASPEPISPTSFGAMGGRLAPEGIQKVVRSKFNVLRVCYERALARDPTAEGKTSTRFVITHQGTTSEVHTTLSGNLPPEVGPCVEAAFQTFVFQAPVGGIVTVTYPVMFAPGE